MTTRQLGGIILILMITSLAQAATLYTRLSDTPVRDHPASLGGVVVAHLPIGSMVETSKPDGADSTVFYIENGKVKTGYIPTALLGDASNKETSALLELENLKISDEELSVFASSGRLVARHSKSAVKSAANAKIKAVPK